MPEDDEFWAIAMEHKPDCDEGLMVDSESDDDGTEGCGATAYRIPYSSSTQITLRLKSLPCSDGVWSPLGSEAWYGSALLATILMQGTDENLGLSGKDSLSILELGSGAVGLSGIIAALRLSKIPGTHSVFLSDNEPKVVGQLKVNLQSASEAMQRDNPDIRYPETHVSIIDWSDKERVLQHEPVDLIFGSELVYTPSTARSCASCIQALLETSPRAKVLIVQVGDRDGWNNIFVPFFETHEQFVLTEETVDADSDAKARQLIMHGGSLDRFDFVVCQIRRRTA